MVQVYGPRRVGAPDGQRVYTRPMASTPADRSIEAFEFRRVVPGGDLSRWVESVWFARGYVPYRQEQVSPTGSTVAAVVLGDPIRQQSASGKGEEFLAMTGFLVGPHDEPIINAPTGETHAVGIVTTPVGCRPLFGLAPIDLAGRIADLEDLWPRASDLRRHLVALAEAGADPDELLAATVARLEQWRAAGRDEHADETGIDRVERAVAMVTADPMRPIADVAAELGISHGHLDDEFARLVGLSPRALSRLLRVRRLLEEVNELTEPVVWSDLAARHGWYDQAHMNRDFKRHTGVSPTTYVARRLEAFGSVEPQPGFVPEPPPG